MYCLARAQAAIGYNVEANKKFEELKDICVDECQKSGEITFDTYYYYGIALYELNNYSEALEKFQNAFNHSINDENKANATFYIGATYYALGDIQSAKQEFENVFQLYDSHHARALFWFGLITNQNNDSPSEALKYLTKAHELSRHKTDILYERGDIYHKMGNIDACIHDKRLAFQLERTDADPLTMKDLYQLLIQQILPNTNQQNISDDIYVILALLYDRVHDLSKNITQPSIYDKEYRKMILMYELDIEKNENNIHNPIYFAYLYELHKCHKHAGAAKVALDQLNYQLDTKPELQIYWNQKLNELREFMDTQNNSQVEHFRNVFRTFSNQILNLTDKQEKMISLLLVARRRELENIEKIRNQVKSDRESFNGDGNGNRLNFYEKMRITLSNYLAAISMTSGDDYNEPIVKHDRTGTQTINHSYDIIFCKIAEGVRLLGDVMGAVIPTGGEAISFLSNFLASLLQKREYGTYQARMELVTNVGVGSELEDIARQVACNLADYYKEQLISLEERHGEVRQGCCSRCCLWFLCNKNKSGTSEDGFTTENQPVKVLQPSVQIAQFGIAYAIQGILVGKIKGIDYNHDTKCEVFTRVITEFICSATPNIKASVLRRLKLDKDAILPHKPLVTSNPDPWYLCEFYRKSGIYIENDKKRENRPPLSWMNPDLYGYRLGTIDEYTNLNNIDTKQITEKSKCCRMM